jgi:hypothetical protein
LAPLLLIMLTIIPLWIVADRGYASHAFREFIWTLGPPLAIPAKVQRDAGGLTVLDLP